MKNFKSRFTQDVINLSILGLLIGIFSINWRILTTIHKPEQNIQAKSDITSLMEEAFEIHRIWWEGEESKEWLRFRDVCLKDLKITSKFDERMLRCNPKLIECVQKFDKNKKFNLNVVGHNNEYFKYLTFANAGSIEIPSSGYYFQISDLKNKKTMDIFLEDHCHEVYLDQRIYGYSEKPLPSEGDDFHFDNFNQNIYIDKNLVTNFDINQWIKFGGMKDSDGLKMIEANELFMPSVQLNLNQMEKYCGFRGKQLLMAHFFDAATFLPMNLDEKAPQVIERGPFYWSKKKKEKTINCDLIFASDCPSKEISDLNLITPTWAGLNESMGGVFEVFRNPIEPNLNLRVSSYYLPLNSKYHRLGLRAHWDGKGNDLKNFNFNEIEIDKQFTSFKVGFRCMRKAI